MEKFKGKLKVNGVVTKHKFLGVSREWEILTDMSTKLFQARNAKNTMMKLGGFRAKWEPVKIKFIEDRKEVKAGFKKFYNHRWTDYKVDAPNIVYAKIQVIVEKKA